MKNITYLFVLLLSAITFGQDMVTQNFSDSGTDIYYPSTTINFNDLNISDSQTVQSITLGSFGVHEGSPGGPSDNCGSYYSFTLFIYGGVNDGNYFTGACDFGAVDITGFTSLVLALDDLDGVDDEVYYDLDIVVNYESLSISETTLEKNIQIYPNPVNQELHVTSLNQITNVEIYDSLGQKIQVLQGRDMKKAIEMSHLNAGFYFVKVNTESTSETFKILKE